MISVYKEAVRDALYPRKNGTLTRRNRYFTTRPVEMMDAAQIRKLRKYLQLSRAVFADMLSVSEKTVEAWENGINVPSGPSLRLLNMIQKYPDLLMETGVFVESIR